jgi:putative endonuclease
VKNLPSAEYILFHIERYANNLIEVNVMYFVYILTNFTNKVLYTGVTSNLIGRVYQHKNKLVEGFTPKYHVDKLVYYDDTTDVKSAIAREKQIKGWARQKKIDLITEFNSKWEDLYSSLS